jgi:hypothetical protein
MTQFMNNDTREKQSNTNKLYRRFCKISTKIDSEILEVENRIARVPIQE